jgi:hypothetical protein
MTSMRSTIKQSGNYLLGADQRYLDLSRIDAGKLSLKGVRIATHFAQRGAFHHVRPG